MILTYEYRLIPSKKQRRVLETLRESQRQLYNAALEERIGAYRRGVVRTLIDQPEGAHIHSCTFRQDDRGWKVGFAISVDEAEMRAGGGGVGVDLFVMPHGRNSFR